MQGKQEQEQRVHKDMVIAEIIALNPEKALEVSQLMADFGIHCIGCMASGFETLEQGVLGHGYRREDLNELIPELNKIISEEKQKDSIIDFKIKLTKSAIEKVKDLIKKNKGNEKILRVSVLRGGCSGYVYNLDLVNKSQHNDFLIEQEGLLVAVDLDSLDYLNGIKVDYVDELNEAGFKFVNPNSTKGCGCGKSFR